MTDRRLGAEIGQALCDVCAAAQRKGDGATPRLVLQALKVARAETGALRRLAACPLGRRGTPGWPLLGRGDA